MGHRIFVAVVVLLWLGTMSWLMVARILPPFFQGEPPRHGNLVQDEPVCWEVFYGGQSVGHAVSQAVPGAAGTTEVHSRVVLEQMQLQQMTPQWMSGLVDDWGEIRLDVRSRLAFDSLGSLATFDTKVQLNDMPLIAKMHGRVDGSELAVRIQSGSVIHEARYPAPTNTLLTSELVPESKLLHVYVGRKWQQEGFSLFRPPNNSMELLQAEVVEEGPLTLRGELCRVRKIEYRTLSTAGVSANNTLRAVVWVADDGTVLCQEVDLMSAKLRFERCREPEMIELAERLLDLDTVATLTTPSLSP